MITEHAILPVITGREHDFEQAFAAAKAFIAASPGFIGLTLSRGIESDSTYLLLVSWESVHDHEIGFRQSDAYAQWSVLLHPFYEPFPSVEHFVEVAIA